MSQASDHGLPIVLGEIPELLPGRQGLRASLNQAIAAKCSAYPQCYLMPFDRWHQKVLKNGYIEIKGKKMTMKELVPDGLHLSIPTSEYLADMMLNLLNRKDVP